MYFEERITINNVDDLHFCTPCSSTNYIEGGLVQTLNVLMPQLVPFNPQSHVGHGM